MSKETILEWFYQNSAALSGMRILTIMVFALGVAAIIFVTYYLTYNGVVYSLKFNVSNVAILLITVVIMLMISSNIVISLGMVGALSIVRFRTAIKDPGDTVFIFWSIIEGLCVGSQNHKLALISTVFIAIILLAFSLVSKQQHKYLVIIRAESGINSTEVETALKMITKRARLRSVNMSKASCEMIYEISGNREVSAKALNALQEVTGVVSVNCILETGENVG